MLALRFQGDFKYEFGDFYCHQYFRQLFYKSFLCSNYFPEMWKKQCFKWLPEIGHKWVPRLWGMVIHIHKQKKKVLILNLWRIQGNCAHETFYLEHFSRNNTRVTNFCCSLEGCVIGMNEVMVPDFRKMSDWWDFQSVCLRSFVLF